MSLAYRLCTRRLCAGNIGPKLSSKNCKKTNSMASSAEDLVTSALPARSHGAGPQPRPGEPRHAEREASTTNLHQLHSLLHRMRASAAKSPPDVKFLRPRNLTVTAAELKHRRDFRLCCILSSLTTQQHQICVHPRRVADLRQLSPLLPSAKFPPCIR